MIEVFVLVFEAVSDGGVLCFCLRHSVIVRFVLFSAEVSDKVFFVILMIALVYRGRYTRGCAFDFKKWITV